MPSYTDLGIPPSGATLKVMAFNMGSTTDFTPAAPFLRPVIPGNEFMHVPFYAFLLEHNMTGRRVMFDLGPRKDLENSAPVISNMFKKNVSQLTVEKDITEQLLEGGIPLESIEVVIWSHTHFDHIGDMSRFPKSTELVIGHGSVLDVYPNKPDSALLASDLNDHKINEVRFDDSNLVIGGFRAVDFFKDGSLYLLDVPGHLSGHITGLARVTPTSFIFIGGDTCHHPAQMRPTEALHLHYPCPGHLVSAARLAISVEHFTPHHSQGGFDLANRNEPLLDIPSGGFYEDETVARESITKLTTFDANDDVFVMISHDSSLIPVIDKYPATLNGWKEKGWKAKSVWGFVDAENPSFRLAVIS